MSQTRIQEGLINSSTVVPSNAGIRFSRNNELIRGSSVAI